MEESNHFSSLLSSSTPPLHFQLRGPIRLARGGCSKLFFLISEIQELGLVLIVKAQLLLSPPLVPNRSN